MNDEQQRVKMSVKIAVLPCERERTLFYARTPNVVFKSFKTALPLSTTEVLSS